MQLWFLWISRRWKLMNEIIGTGIRIPYNYLDISIDLSWTLNELIDLAFWSWEGREFQRRSPNTWALAILNDVLA